MITISPGLTSLSPTLVDGVFEFQTVVDPQLEAGDVTVNGANIATLPTVDDSGNITVALSTQEYQIGNVIRFEDQSIPKIWNELEYFIDNISLVSGQLSVDIRANTGETKAITVPALDDAGDPVDLSGYSNLEFSASDRCRSVFVEEPAVGANGSFTFTLPEIENERSGLWTLRETTTSKVITSGKIRVAYNAEGEVA